MRKYKLIYVIAFMTFLGLSACEDKLELDPYQSIDAEETNTSEKVLLTANSVYERMQNADLFGANMNYFSELLGRSSDVSWVGTFNTKREMGRKLLLINNADVRDVWSEAYYTINICNIVLSKLDIIEDADDRNRVEAEMLATRGWIYFELTRFWGKQYDTSGSNSQLAVPILLEPVEGEDDVTYPARNTVGEVYTRVLSDLTGAEALFASYHTATGDNRMTFLNVNVVKAVLARVYLQMGDYANATIKANDVIESGMYNLVDAPLKAFNNSSYTPEDIFALQQTALSNAGESNAGLTTHYASLSGNGRGDMEMTSDFLDLFEIGDLRGEITTDLASSALITDVSTMYYIGVGQSSNNGGINTAKYGDGKKNTPLIRFAEMYLIRAEGNFEEGTSLGDTPLNDINRVRARSNASAYTTVNQDNIRQERYFELCWEGFRLHDLRRWNVNIYNPDDDTESIAYDADRLVLPVPERELEVNDNLVQNSGY
ncbi:RagB/SusD family nutrient uptake outer membrane protein [Marinifilum caeruleilacunae]|uniref:RagB/SusD family nutrient uptake outer membrane protein n=1 Tax=Marinifilum caeruleilacunae TaxID=2499076 RepID=A0ABX1WTV8_9BACT|nr:RagB/SusD family nutrient uptake outer membrane protein [Marinifilum caeruleilacunae]NOU59545.1 RagB/SusD family nutrient uptake outer membrane protein [Marinifilum caeruleilacunae]